jgi:hypothetical protein
LEFIDPDYRSEFGPRDRAISRHEGKQKRVVTAFDDERFDDIGGAYPQERRSFRQRTRLAAVVIAKLNELDVKSAGGGVCCDSILATRHTLTRFLGELG